MGVMFFCRSAGYTDVLRVMIRTALYWYLALFFSVFYICYGIRASPLEWLRGFSKVCMLVIAALLILRMQFLGEFYIYALLHIICCRGWRRVQSTLFLLSRFVFVYLRSLSQ